MKMLIGPLIIRNNKKRKKIIHDNASKNGLSSISVSIYGKDVILPSILEDEDTEYDPHERNRINKIKRKANMFEWLRGR